MAKVVKKKKKKLGSIGASRGPSTRETSDLRPRHTPMIPPCKTHCPNNNLIRDALTTIAQSEGYGRTYEESLEMAWGIWTENWAILMPMAKIIGVVVGVGAVVAVVSDLYRRFFRSR